MILTDLFSDLFHRILRSLNLKTYWLGETATPKTQSPPLLTAINSLNTILPYMSISWIRLYIDY